MCIKPGIKIFFITLLLVVFSSSVSFAAINYPFIDTHLKTPNPDDPYAGYGTMHSALSTSISTALWNPAGLTKIPTGEITVLLSQKNPSYAVNRTNDVEDQTFDMGEDNSGFTANVYFSRTDLTTPRTREVTSFARHKSESVDISYGQAVKFNDFFTFAIMTRGNTAADVNLIGEFPFTTVFDLNLIGQTNYQGSGLSVHSDGTVTVSGEGYSHTSAGPLWSGFLTQTSSVPASTYTEMTNSFSVNSDLIISAASKTGDFSWGINIIPISATANINNIAQVLVSEDTADAALYAPNFNTSDEADVVRWLTDPNQYASEDGYDKTVIGMPNGEIIGDVAYSGTYTGNTMRIDLGATYDYADVLTLSIVAENVNGATLDMKGEGITTYGTHRVNTSESPSLNLTDGGISWDPFSDQQQAIPESENWYLDPNVSIPLPKRMRYGIALRKPFLISLDLEQQLTPIQFASEQNGTYVTTKISGINILRVGMETQFFMVPLWFRGSTALLLKPTIENNPDLAKSIDDAYANFPVYPAMLDLGANIRAWDTDLGLSFGFNALSLISMVQVDTVNNNLSKILYFTAYGSRGPWEITYTQAFDPISTATAYFENHTSQDFNDGKYSYSDLKWFSTLAVTYRF
ncbi:MAG: hypothetical protein KKB81_05015 [Candidatus Margulisbacteria bacterium]|nr:hypothetical protein [Candidatus Margulisiibacteriota bacterium]MBU1021381.1 hypothetical protein [Candidatus Margulisiibacteriota bacterium]MBU1729130.1 hypothetical protein [Candidatus Margulisiibacteriota bacterium]MBU1954803.1 hypothetical protein [Candidatus Margulisiibacteriota bacterium]